MIDNNPESEEEEDNSEVMSDTPEVVKQEPIR